jgi:hypothetical protein
LREVHKGVLQVLDRERLLGAVNAEWVMRLTNDN